MNMTSVRKSCRGRLDVCRSSPFFLEWSGVVVELWGPIGRVALPRFKAEHPLQA